MSRKKLLPLREAREKLKIHMMKMPGVISSYSPYVPKFFIPEPRGRYHGLFLELIGAGNKAFTKEGGPTKCNPYSAYRYENMKKLEDLGFKCQIVKGFEEAKIAIDKYLNK